MQQRMIDRWIETAEARRVCGQAMAVQMLARPVAPMPQPLSLMAKLRATLMLGPAHQHPAFTPTVRSAI